MFQYEKRLQYPVNIKNPNPKLAKIIITQYGGPDEPLILIHRKMITVCVKFNNQKVIFNI